MEGASYKGTAAALGIRLENLKMVIFRGRRKIFRGLHKTLQSFAAPLAKSAHRHSTVRSQSEGPSHSEGHRHSKGHPLSNRHR